MPELAVTPLPFLKKIFTNTVFKNFSYLSIGSVLSQLISLLTIIKITQALSPNDYGIYTFLIVQGTLLLTISDLGLRNIVIRSIAREPARANDIIFNSAVLKSAAILFLSLLYILYNSLFGSLNSEQLLFVFLFSFISCFIKLFETAYLGNQKMLPPALVNLAFSIVWFAVIYLLPANLITVTFLFILFLAVNLVKAVIYYIFLKYQRLLKGEIRNFWSSSRGLLKESWPYFALILVMLPFTQFSNNFLDLNSTAIEIGYFNLSERLIGPVSFVLDFALIAIFPNLSSLWIKNEKQFNRFVSVGFKYFILLALVFCFLFTLFARDVVTSIFPASYLPAVAVCQLQIWYLFLTSIDSLIGTILGATNKEKMILKLGILRSLISTPMLYYGSTFGALGLSYGYVISFALFQIYLWYVFKKTTRIKINLSGMFWLLSIALFFVAQFAASHISFIYKLILALAVLGGAAFHISKTYRLTTT